MVLSHRNIWVNHKVISTFLSLISVLTCFRVWNNIMKPHYEKKVWITEHTFVNYTYFIINTYNCNCDVIVKELPFPPAGLDNSEKVKDLSVITLSFHFFLIVGTFWAFFLAMSHSDWTGLKKFFSPLKAAAFQLSSNWDVLSLCKRRTVGGTDGNKAGKGQLGDKETKRHCYVYVSDNDSQHSHAV